MEYLKSKTYFKIYVDPFYKLIANQHITFVPFTKKIIFLKIGKFTKNNSIFS